MVPKHRNTPPPPRVMFLHMSSLLFFISIMLSDQVVIATTPFLTILSRLAEFVSKGSERIVLVCYNVLQLVKLTQLKCQTVEVASMVAVKILK